MKKRKAKKGKGQPPQIAVHEFSPDNSCPGCGATDAAYDVTFGGDYGNPPLGGYIRDDHILRNCPHCRVYWPEAIPDDPTLLDSEGVPA